MKAIRILNTVLLAIGIAAIGHSARAQESSVKFLRRLQENGYGDMAVEYLQILQNRSQVPKEIAGSWDLEMSKSLQLAATAAFDSAEYERLMDQSQTHLAKFLKENPDHPEAVAAMALMSEFPVKRALQLIRTAKTTEDPEQKTALLVEARQTLTDLRGRFQQAVEQYAATLAEPALRPKKSNRAADARQDAESNIREALFQSALIDYYLAQSHLDPKSREHLGGLAKAGKEFDALYQANRTNVTGIYAHMWHGKAAEENWRKQHTAKLATTNTIQHEHPH